MTTIYTPHLKEVKNLGLLIVHRLSDGIISLAAVMCLITVWATRLMDRLHHMTAWKPVLHFPAALSNGHDRSLIHQNKYEPHPLGTYASSLFCMLSWWSGKRAVAQHGAFGCFKQTTDHGFKNPHRYTGSANDFSHDCCTLAVANHCKHHKTFIWHLNSLNQCMPCFPSAGSKTHKIH